MSSSTSYGPEIHLSGALVGDTTTLDDPLAVLEIWGGTPRLFTLVFIKVTPTNPYKPLINDLAMMLSYFFTHTSANLSLKLLCCEESQKHKTLSRVGSHSTHETILARKCPYTDLNSRFASSISLSISTPYPSCTQICHPPGSRTLPYLVHTFQKFRTLPFGLRCSQWYYEYLG